MTIRCHLRRDKELEACFTIGCRHVEQRIILYRAPWMPTMIIICRSGGMYIAMRVVCGANRERQPVTEGGARKRRYGMPSQWSRDRTGIDLTRLFQCISCGIVSADDCGPTWLPTVTGCIRECLALWPKRPNRSSGRSNRFNRSST